MSPSRKTHQRKKKGQQKKLVIAASITLIITCLVLAAYFWRPPNGPVDNQGIPQGLQTLADHYMNLMQTLNSSQTKEKMAEALGSNYNQTELFAWEQSKLDFTQDTTGWYEDPIQILNSGKGICVQHSIVYIAACLAQNYQSRLVVSVDTSRWGYIHTWAEDYFNGQWVHVDPSDGIWNNPQMYKDWWGEIGSGIRVYAFEDNAFYDVTTTYSTK